MCILFTQFHNKMNERTIGKECKYLSKLGRNFEFEAYFEESGVMNL